jgi:hypothetical protein
VLIISGMQYFDRCEIVSKMRDGFDVGLNANLEGDLHDIVCCRAWNNYTRHQGIKAITKMWRTSVLATFGLMPKAYK